MPGLNDAFYPAGSMVLSITSLGTTANRFTTGGLQALLVQNNSTCNVVGQMGVSSTIVATAGSSAGFINGMFTVPANGWRIISTPPDPYLSFCTTAVSISGVITITPGLGKA